MLHSRPSQPVQGEPGESGYILIGVLILMAVFIMALAVAAPIVARDIQRDKEVEAVHRGKQYIRAIKLYYKRFGAYPSSLDQLDNTNGIRYLRKHYTDPMTGKDDWRLIHVGEAKVPVMGFFGEPMQAGVSSVTTGLQGNGTGGLPGSGTTAPASDPNDPNNASVPADPNNPTPQQPAYALPGMSAAQQAGGANNNNGNSPFEAGGLIVGVGLPVEKHSIVVFHKQEGYKKWEFTYDPLQDQQTLSSGGIPGATPVTGAVPTGPGGLPQTPPPNPSPAPSPTQ